jgi:thiol-disulfide isomerase/thioredoxin
MLAQTFATTPGENYTLRFVQGDEQMAGPSTSELTVSVADVQRVFSREHDTGMVVKTLHFTAKSNLTTLRFADTSPNIPDAVHSPFLDAVSVVPGSLAAPAINATVKPTARELVGKSVPKAFKLPLLTGGEIELPPSTNQGPLLLDFFASWCGPCREAMPVLAGIAKDYSARGVRYVAVNQGEAPETIRRYLASAKLELSVALDKKCGMAGAFKVDAIPTIVLVDRSNTIRDVHVGTSRELGDELRAALDEVLKDPPRRRERPAGTDGNRSPN